MVKFDFSGFFDRKAVLNAVGRAGVRVLGEMGRLVRKRAQASLRYEAGTAAAGEPPHAHKTGMRRRVSKSTGKVRVRSVSYLREFLFFKYDPATQSVVVGPERLSSTVDPRALPALEFGGRSSTKSHGKRVGITVRAHPFMRPALQAEQPGFASLWRNSVRP